MARIMIISHWCKLIENHQMSSLDFYNSVEQAIKKREVPETESSRVEYHEGAMFSAKRQYLRIERKNLAFDICAAPFGTGFFISSWFGKAASKGGIFRFLGVVVVCLILFPVFQNIFGAFIGIFFWIIGMPCLLLLLGYMISDGMIGGEDAVLETPILGLLYAKIFNPLSYYKLDTMQMYQAAIHAAVMEAIDEITNAKGLRGLTELERKPVMKDFLGK
jgi:hypothetical protein